MSSIPVKTKQPCPFEGCGSSDAYYIYEDANGNQFGKCYSCKQTAQISGDAHVTHTTAPQKPSALHKGSTPTKPYRGVPLSVLLKFGVENRVDGNSGDTTILYPYYDRKTEALLGQKCRVGQGKGKRFYTNVDSSWSRKTTDLPLFGSHLFPAGGRRITVTEGEDDTLAHYAMMGDYPVVSLNGGVDTVSKMSEEMYDYLSSFEQIVVSFDADEQGREAAKSFAEIFPTKVRILEMPKKDGVVIKDALDCLNNNLHEQYKRNWFNAPKYAPDDIVYSSSLIDYILNREKPTPVPYPFEPLNKLLYGMHQPEVILVTAETKGGKSLFTGALQNHLLGIIDGPIADVSIEDTPGRRAETLLSLHIQKPLHIPEIRDAMLADNKEFLEVSAKNLFGDDRVVFYKNFGVSDTDEILRRLKYFIEVLGCRYIVFDHISYAASYHEGDERKNLDRLSNQLASLATTSGICLIVVAHENRQGQVHGSSNVEKTCFTHLRLSRFRDHPNPNAHSLTKVHVKLNRLYGRDGYFFLRYSEDPFGFSVVPTEEAEEILETKE